MCETDEGVAEVGSSDLIYPGFRHHALRGTNGTPGTVCPQSGISGSGLMADRPPSPALNRKRSRRPLGGGRSRGAANYEEPARHICQFSERMHTQTSLRTTEITVGGAVLTASTTPTPSAREARKAHSRVKLDGRNESTVRSLNHAAQASLSTSIEPICARYCATSVACSRDQDWLVELRRLAAYGRVGSALGILEPAGDDRRGDRGSASVWLVHP